MSKETIEVTIAGRSYPLSVLPEEVEGVEGAAIAIDERLAELKSQFAVQDRIDLFAMTALQLSIRVKQLEKLEAKLASDKDGEEEFTLELVGDLTQRINSVLKS